MVFEPLAIKMVEHTSRIYINTLTNMPIRVGRYKRTPLAYVLTELGISSTFITAFINARRSWVSDMSIFRNVLNLGAECPKRSQTTNLPTHISYSPNRLERYAIPNNKKHCI